MSTIPQISVKIMEGETVEFSLEGNYCLENQNIHINGKFKATISDNIILISHLRLTTLTLIISSLKM
jgi:hypothetical protein